MNIKGLPLREYLKLLNLIIYWDLMDYNERMRERDDQSKNDVERH